MRNNQIVGTWLDAANAIDRMPHQNCYLDRFNCLGEFRTELEKAKARANLGIADKYSLHWGNIDGYIEDLEDLIVLLKKLIKKYGSELSVNVEDIVEDLNNKLEKLDKLVKDSVGDAVEDATGDISDKIAQVNQMTAQIRTLLDDVDGRVNAAISKVYSDSEARLQSVINGLGNDIDVRVDTALNNVWSDTDARVDAKIAQVDAKLALLDGAAGSNVDTRLTAVETKAAGNESRISTIERNLNNLSAAVEEIDDDVEDALTKAQAAKSTADGLVTRVESIETKVNTVETKVNNVESEVNTVKTSVETINNTLTEKVTEINTIKETVTQLSDVVTNVSEIVENNEFITENHNTLNEVVENYTTIINAVEGLEETYATKAELSDVDTIAKDNQYAISQLPKSTDIATKDYVTQELGKVTSLTPEQIEALSNVSTDIQNAQDAIRAEVSAAINEAEANNVEWSDVSTHALPGRKALVLNNHDLILGFGNNCLNNENDVCNYEGGEDLTGQSFNIAMVSRWNVADFGSSKIKLNLNAKDDIVTINDKAIVATLNYVNDSLVNKITELNLAQYAKAADVANTYVSKTDANNTYLSKTEAESKYLTITQAQNNYAPAATVNALSETVTQISQNLEGDTFNTTIVEALASETVKNEVKDVTLETLSLAVNDDDTVDTTNELYILLCKYIDNRVGEILDASKD